MAKISIHRWASYVNHRQHPVAPELAKASLLYVISRHFGLHRFPPLPLSLIVPAATPFSDESPRILDLLVSLPAVETRVVAFRDKTPNSLIWCGIPAMGTVLVDADQTDSLVR